MICGILEGLGGVVGVSQTTCQGYCLPKQWQWAWRHTTLVWAIVVHACHPPLELFRFEVLDSACSTRLFPLLEAPIILSWPIWFNSESTFLQECFNLTWYLLPWQVFTRTIHPSAINSWVEWVVACPAPAHAFDRRWAQNFDDLWRLLPGAVNTVHSRLWTGQGEACPVSKAVDGWLDILG